MSHGCSPPLRLATRLQGAITSFDIEYNSGSGWSSAVGAYLTSTGTQLRLKLTTTSDSFAGTEVLLPAAVTVSSTDVSSGAISTQGYTLATSATACSGSSFGLTTCYLITGSSAWNVGEFTVALSTSADAVTTGWTSSAPTVVFKMRWAATADIYSAAVAGSSINGVTQQAATVYLRITPPGTTIFGGAAGTWTCANVDITQASITLTGSPATTPTTFGLNSIPAGTGLSVGTCDDSSIAGTLQIPITIASARQGHTYTVALLDGAFSNKGGSSYTTWKSAAQTLSTTLAVSEPVALGSHDVEYSSDGGVTWTSATSGSPPLLKGSWSMRLKVKYLSGATTFPVLPTITPAKVQFTPSTGSAAAASTFGYTVAASSDDCLGGSTLTQYACFAITGASHFVGGFSVQLLSAAVTFIDSSTKKYASDAITSTTVAFTMGWVPTLNMTTTAVGTTSATGGSSKAAGATFYLKVGYSSGYIATASKWTVTGGGSNDKVLCTGTSSSDDVRIDITKVIFTESATGYSYTGAQAGLTIASVCTSSESASVTAFLVTVENYRMGGTFAVSLLDGAFVNAQTYYKSVAIGASIASSSLIISSPNAIGVTYDIGVVGGNSAIGGSTARYVTSSDALYLKVRKTDGSAFVGTPTLRPERVVITGTSNGAISSTTQLVFPASANSTNAGQTVYWYLLTSSSAPLDVYSIRMAPGAISDSGSGTWYSSNAVTVTGLVVSWAPAGLGVTNTGKTTVLGTAQDAGSYYVKVSYPTTVGTVALAVTCDVSKFTLQAGGVTYPFARVGATNDYSAAGITITGGTVTADAATRDAYFALVINATAWGGTYSLDLQDGACYVGSSGVKNRATSGAITTFKVKASVVAQLISISSSATNAEVIADSSTSATASRKVGYGENLRIRLIKYGPAWTAPLTVTTTAAKFVFTGGSGTLPTVTQAGTQCNSVAASGSSPGYTYCDFNMTFASTSAPTTTWNLQLVAGIIADGASLSSADVTNHLIFGMAWTPSFKLTTDNTYATEAAVLDKSSYSWAPGQGSLYLAVGVGNQAASVTTFNGAVSAWQMDWSKVTIKDSTGTTITASASGITLPTGTSVTASAMSSDSKVLFFGPFVIASNAPRVDTYSLDFAEGAIKTGSATNGNSAQSVSALSGGFNGGIKIGFTVTATLVRSDKTTSLTGIYLDRNDNDVYLKLTASGISNFGACSAITVDPTKFTFKSTNPDASTTAQTVSVTPVPYPCVENSPDAYFKLNMASIADSGSTGAYILDLGMAAITAGSTNGYTNYAASNVITTSSRVMMLGYPVAYTVVDRYGYDMTSTGRQLSPGGVYYLRIQRTSEEAFTSTPTIDVTKFAVTKGGVSSSDITITTTGLGITRLGNGIVDIPLSVATTAVAGTYSFSVSAGFLTYNSIQTGKWSNCLSQDVGMHVSVDMIDSQGNSIEGRTIDASVSSQRVFYVRMWRTAGSFATSGNSVPYVNTGSSGCYDAAGSTGAPCISINRLDLQVTPSATSPATPSKSGTPTIATPSGSRSGSPVSTASPTGGAGSPSGTPPNTASPSSTIVSSGTPSPTTSVLRSTYNIDFTVYRSTATYVDFRVTLTTNIPAGSYTIDFGEGEWRDSVIWCWTT